MDDYQPGFGLAFFMPGSVIYYQATRWSERPDTDAGIASRVRYHRSVGGDAMPKDEFDDFDGIFFLHRQMQQFTGEDRAGSRKSHLGWIPLADIFETDRAFLIMMEVPGVHQDDLEIWWEGKILNIRGEKKPDQDSSAECFFQMEREFGEFSRSFSFEVEVSSEGIEAVIKDGTLTVTVPKAKGRAAKEIEIT
jgi:HSP20 family protein